MAQLNPYLHFTNQTREAMGFYQTVFGGELQLMAFKDIGMPVEPDEADNIMHASLTAPTITFFASDTPKHMEINPGGTIGMSLSGTEEDELRGYWQKLSEGASVMQPLEKAPWGDIFGMLADKFGIEWMVNITGEHPQA